MADDTFEDGAGRPPNARAIDDVKVTGCSAR
jgi:hypothetical protein